MIEGHALSNAALEIKQIAQDIQWSHKFLIHKPSQHILETLITTHSFL